MKTIIKTMKSLGIVMGVLVLLVILDSISYRYSLFYWMCVSVTVLPVLFWINKRFKVAVVITALIGTALALSPMDITFKPGELGVHILSTSHGIATRPGTVGYGCTVRNSPVWALVFSF